MFNTLLHAVSGSPWTYLVIAGVCAGDAVLPLFPAETAVIAGAVLASRGQLNIALVVVAAFLGALGGDNAAYWLGRGALSRLADRLLHTEPNQQRLRWARTQLRRSGPWIIIVARFVPGGRSATTYVAGTLEMRWAPRFLPADTVAALVWGLYSAALGYLGGRAFESNFWLPLVIATGASLVIAAVGELVRRKVLNRRPG